MLLRVLPMAPITGLGSKRNGNLLITYRTVSVLFMRLVLETLSNQCCDLTNQYEQQTSVCSTLKGF